MVRNVVGAMLAVSCGTLKVSDIEGVFAAGVWAGGESHKTAAMPAPAHGLTLERVFYGDEQEQLLLGGADGRAGRQNWL
jgi:tRNA U38,U39,U40 pseudouridine synthase TruA